MRTRLLFLILLSVGLISALDTGKIKTASADSTSYGNGVIDLGDTPKTYSGQAGKSLVVNSTEDGMEFGNSGITPGQSAAFNNVTARGKYYGDGSNLTGISARPNSYANVSGMATNAHTKSAFGSYSGREVQRNSAFLNRSGGVVASTLEFNGHVAKNMLNDSGATLPAHGLNKTFLHTPTGRKVLMLCDGTTWLPHSSIGGLTMYVDGSGTDSADKGYGTGANAFKTAQYCIDQIPGVYSGDISLTLAAGTYSGFVWRGKNPEGNFTATISGALTLVKSGVIDSATAGFPGADSTLTDTGNFTATAHINQILKITSGTYSGRYYLIKSNTTDVLTIATTWTNNTTAPAASVTYEIYSADTIIDGADASTYAVLIDGGTNIVLQNMVIERATLAGLCINRSSVTLNNVIVTNCDATASTDNVLIDQWSKVTANTVLSYTAGRHCVFVSGKSSFSYSDIYCYGSANSGLIVANASEVYGQCARFGSCLRGIYLNNVAHGILTNEYIVAENCTGDGLLMRSNCVIAILRNAYFNTVVTGIDYGVGSLIANMATGITYNGNTTNVLKASTTKQAGTATLSGGTVTVANTGIAAADIIMLTRVSGVAQIGTLTYKISAGTSFTISSTNNLDTGVVAYQIISP